MSYGKGGRTTLKMQTRQEAARVIYRRPVDRPGEWSGADVAGRLYEAMRALRRAVGHVGPREYGNAMPDVLRPPLTIAEMIEQMHDQNLHRLDNKIELAAMTAEIGRAEEAIEWPGRYLVDRWPGALTVLQIWMRAIGSGRRPTAALREAGYSKNAAQHFLDKAFEEIAAGLNRDKVKLEAAADEIF